MIQRWWLPMTSICQIWRSTLNLALKQLTELIIPWFFTCLYTLPFLVFPGSVLCSMLNTLFSGWSHSVSGFNYHLHWWPQFCTNSTSLHNSRMTDFIASLYNKHSQHTDGTPDPSVPNWRLSRYSIRVKRTTFHLSCSGQPSGNPNPFTFSSHTSNSSATL